MHTKYIPVLRKGETQYSTLFMVFVFISLAAAGGAIGVICLILFIVVIVRSRVRMVVMCKNRESNGLIALEFIFLLRNEMDLQQSFRMWLHFKIWFHMNHSSKTGQQCSCSVSLLCRVASYPIFTHTVVNRRFLWSYLYPFVYSLNVERKVQTLICQIMYFALMNLLPWMKSVIIVNNRFW